jgi:hypothetical protein
MDVDQFVDVRNPMIVASWDVSFTAFKAPTCIPF